MYFFACPARAGPDLVMLVGSLRERASNAHPRTLHCTAHITQKMRKMSGSFQLQHSVLHSRGQLALCHPTCLLSGMINLLDQPAEAS